MSNPETELDIARRYVISGRVLLMKQQRVVAELEADGHPTETAKELLVQLQQAQLLHEEHLCRLEVSQAALERVKPTMRGLDDPGLDA